MKNKVKKLIATAILGTAFIMTGQGEVTKEKQALESILINAAGKDQKLSRSEKEGLARSLGYKGIFDNEYAINFDNRDVLWGRYAARMTNGNRAQKISQGDISKHAQENEIKIPKLHEYFPSIILY